MKRNNRWKQSKRGRKMATLAISWLATGCCIAVVFGNRQLGAAEDPVLIREFIYDEASFPECHASTICETSNGLLCAWFGGTYERHPDVGIWVSRHDGGDWSDPTEVANGIQYTDGDGSVVRHPCWNPVLHTSSDGTVYLFYKCGPSPSGWWGMLTTSKDSGRTWSQPSRLPEGIDGPVRNKLVVVEDDVWLCGSSTEYDGWRVHFELTADRGTTWTRVGPIENGATQGGIQPTILPLANGELRALCRDRNGDGNVLETHSLDGGQNWSPLTATTLPNPNSGIDAVVLEDGRVLLVYNHTHRSGAFPAGREMLNVAVSADGENWQAALVLEREDNSEFSYPAVIQTSDGNIHLTYTWKRRRICHVVLDPAALQLSEFVDGAWPTDANESSRN